jgi:digeranylgeranylglycerophospholipid reductase
LEVDVLIVGAGPAGSTTAKYCAGKGLDVVLIDRRREIGYPVQCGEFLPAIKEMYSMFPETIELEELLTVDDSLIESVTHSIDLISPKGREYRCPFEGMTLNRRAFDKHLARLAVEAGARLETNTSMKSIKNGVASTTIGDIKARVIVGADGPNSRTARDSGLQRPTARYPAIACQAQGDFEPVVKMYFGSLAPGGYGWIIPKAEGANVGVGFMPELLKDRPTELFERFAAKIGVSSYTDLTMGFVPQSGPVKQTVKDSTLLVGDAAGQVMASNGGGIPIAMIAGRIAGRTIKEHIQDRVPLEAYDRRWRAVLGRPLANSLWTKRLGDLFFPSDRRTEFAMRVLGRRGLARAIRCTKVFYVL